MDNNQVTEAIRTVNKLLARRRSMGALSREEDSEMNAALSLLEKHDVSWTAWLGDIELAYGKTESEAIENAVKTYEHEIGYNDTIQCRQELIQELEVGISDEK